MLVHQEANLISLRCDCNPRRSAKLPGFLSLFARAQRPQECSCVYVEHLHAVVASVGNIERPGVHRKAAGIVDLPAITTPLRPGWVWSRTTSGFIARDSTV